MMRKQKRKQGEEKLKKKKKKNQKQGKQTERGEETAAEEEEEDEDFWRLLPNDIVQWQMADGRSRKASHLLLPCNKRRKTHKRDK